MDFLNVPRCFLRSSSAFGAERGLPISIVATELLLEVRGIRHLLSCCRVRRSTLLHGFQRRLAGTEMTLTFYHEINAGNGHAGRQGMMDRYV